MDMASARREGACNPHNRCMPADRARRRGALLSRLPAWRCAVGCVRLRAPCPGVPGLWKSVRPRILENRASRAASFFAMIYKMDGFLPTVHQGNRSAPSRPHQGGCAHLWDVTARRHLTYIRDL